jgi:hypothetical protein
VNKRLIVWIAFAVLAAASACADRAEQPPPPTPPAPPAAYRVVTARPDTLDCMRPEPDSVSVLGAAFAALSQPEVPLRLSSFVRHHEGVLVSLLPAATHTTGGGGLVWVDRDGCLTVLKRYE